MANYVSIPTDLTPVLDQITDVETTQAKTPNIGTGQVITVVQAINNGAWGSKISRSGSGYLQVFVLRENGTVSNARVIIDGVSTILLLRQVNPSQDIATSPILYYSTSFSVEIFTNASDYINLNAIDWRLT